MDRLARLRDRVTDASARAVRDPAFGVFTAILWVVNLVGIVLDAVDVYQLALPVTVVLWVGSGLTATALIVDLRRQIGQLRNDLAGVPDQVTKAKADAEVDAEARWRGTVARLESEVAEARDRRSVPRTLLAHRDAAAPLLEVIGARTLPYDRKEMADAMRRAVEWARAAVALIEEHRPGLAMEARAAAAPEYSPYGQPRLFEYLGETYDLEPPDAHAKMLRRMQGLLERAIASLDA